MGKNTATLAAKELTAPTVTQGLSQTRLHIVILGLWFCLFLSALDATIVTTALIKISSSFDALEKGTWLITAYLLTYNAFLMITARLSDVWGLKIMLLSCAAIFLVASMACGAAQTMIQLIVFRAFQGVGGSGLYSLTFVSIMKLIVPEKIGFYSGVISSVFAVANLLGPLLGGIISDRTTWRWIFFMNGPIVVVAIVLLCVAMPALKDGKSNRERVKGLDGVGGLLSVCWPVPLIFALQEAGGAYKWSSGVIIGTLTIGIVLFIVFGLHETWITYRTARDPIFPIHFLREPSMALILLSQFLVGMPFYVVFVQLPQRFQTVNFTSAERAGILLLPATCVTAVGAMLASVGMKKLAIEYIALIALSMICLSVGLISSLPATSKVWAGTYGYEIITGLGLGLTGPVFYILMGSTVAEKDISVGTGALNTVRTLGGCVAVAICSAIHREYTNDRLSHLLSSEQISAAQSSSTFIAQLPVALREEIGEIFGRSYNRQFQVMLAFSGLNIIVGIMLAVARKRAGLFGQIPQRKESNEFMEAAKVGENETSQVSEKGIKGDEASQSSKERKESAPVNNELSIQQAGAREAKT